MAVTLIGMQGGKVVLITTICSYKFLYICIYTGWWLSHPSEKYARQLGLFFPICGKIKNVPNHQPVYIYVCILIIV